MKRRFRDRSRFCFPLLAGAAFSLPLAQPARAVDEIQVYNANIAAVGQFTITQHLNYVGIGQKDPPFPGGFASDHSINGTPEFAYGVTDWWEVELYLPFAIKSQQLLSDAFKLRTLFVTPNADQRNFFYGVNFEFSHEMPKFAQTRFGLEIRPIIGVRNASWEFIVNPIVDIGFGKNGEADFTPAARLARKLELRPVRGSRILCRSRRDRQFQEARRSAAHAVCRHGFQAWRLRRELRRWLRADAGFRPLRRQDHRRLRIPGAGQQFRSERPRSASGPVNPMAHASARRFQP